MNFYVVKILSKLAPRFRADFRNKLIAFYHPFFFFKSIFFIFFEISWRFVFLKANLFSSKFLEQFWRKKVRNWIIFFLYFKIFKKSFQGRSFYQVSWTFIFVKSNLFSSKFLEHFSPARSKSDTKEQKMDHFQRIFVNEFTLFNPKKLFSGLFSMIFKVLNSKFINSILNSKIPRLIWGEISVKIYISTVTPFFYTRVRTSEQHLAS